jgi:hypothetical protein
MSPIFEPDNVYLFGTLCATELVLRVWLGPTAGHGPSRGEAILLTAVIMAAASNTYDRTYIRLLAPLYSVALLLSARWLIPPTPPSRRPVLLGMRVTAAIIAISLGFVMVASVTRFDQTLTNWAAGLLNASRRGRPARVGLNVSPRLGATFNPQPSMERILLIDGPINYRHLRARAFDVYQDRRWPPPAGGNTFAPVEVQDLRSAEQSGRQQTLDISIIGDTVDLLLLPLNTSALESQAALERDDMGTVRHRQPIGNARYTVTSSADEQFQGPLCPPITQAQRQRALMLPAEVDPKVIELATRVAGNDASLARVIRLTDYLRATHSYSLTYDPGAGEPLSDFILNNRAAHCQYFASALTIMARAIGVPARMVVGYYAHESYGTDRMVVRDRDAHAWTECWIDGVGWITLDATPSAGLPDGLFGPPSRLRLAWERIEDFPGTVRDWLGSLSRTTVLAVVFASSGLALLVQFIQSRRRRRPTRQREYAKPQAPLGAISRRFEKWIARTSQSCAANRTWREHVASAHAAPIITQFLDVWDESRFGGANGQRISRLMELMEQLELGQNSSKGGNSHG